MARNNVVKIGKALARPEPQKGKTSAKSVVIAAPNFAVAALKIKGTAPYVQCAFSEKSQNIMIDRMKDPTLSSRRNRGAKDFDAAYEGAMHKSRQGWIGIPAPAFRNAMISACRTVNFKMTLAKLSLFVEADGFDAVSGQPLVKITKGQPHKHMAPARNANGSTDIRCRPMFDEGWEATVRVKWDADQFSTADVVNLMARVGQQVGVGEGRPDSRESPGCGWGTFEVVN